MGPIYTADELERLLATAVVYLLNGGDFDKRIANILISSNIKSVTVVDDYDPSYGTHRALQIHLEGSRDLVEILSTWGDEKEAIDKAFGAILGDGHLETEFRIIKGTFALLDIDKDWRTRLLAENDTQEATNQNPYTSDPIIWQGMKFNSPPEVAIAKALDKASVTYFANCLVRLGPAQNRLNRIPDFLICFQGKWGLLEVDGKKYHTPTNATQDHDRRRLLEQYSSIRYSDRFSADRCLNEPDEVVSEFLNILNSK
jgi:hypothetical protein